MWRNVKQMAAGLKWKSHPDDHKQSQTQFKDRFKTSLQIATVAFFFANSEKNVEKMKLETHLYSNYVPA